MATLVKDRFGSTEQLKVESSSSSDMLCFLNKNDLQYPLSAFRSPGHQDGHWCPSNNLQFSVCYHLPEMNNLVI